VRGVVLELPCNHQGTDATSLSDVVPPLVSCQAEPGCVRLSLEPGASKVP